MTREPDGRTGRCDHLLVSSLCRPKASLYRATPFCLCGEIKLDLLAGSSGSNLHLSDEAKLNLYETIGFLVGMPSVPVDKQVRVFSVSPNALRGTHLAVVLG